MFFYLLDSFTHLGACLGLAEVGSSVGEGDETHTHIHTHTHISEVHVCVCVCVYVYTYTYTHTYIRDGHQCGRGRRNGRGKIGGNARDTLVERRGGMLRVP